MVSWMPCILNSGEKMKISVSAEPFDALSFDSLALGLFSDERPPRGYAGLADWRMNGLVSDLIVEGKITGAFLEKVFISSDRRGLPSKILFIGLGESTQLTYEKLYTVGCTILQTLREAECCGYAFDVPGSDRCRLEVSKIALAMVSGVFESRSVELDDIESDISLLAGKDAFDEVVLGMHEFKISVRSKATVDVIVGDHPTEAL